MKKLHRADSPTMRPGRKFFAKSGKHQTGESKQNKEIPVQDTTRLNSAPSTEQGSTRNFN